MTNEEALQIVKMAIKCVENRHNEYFCQEDFIKEISERYELEIILDAIEKQIPKKPNEIYCPTYEDCLFLTVSMEHH